LKLPGNSRLIILSLLEDQNTPPLTPSRKARKKLTTELSEFHRGIFFSHGLSFGQSAGGFTARLSQQQQALRKALVFF
ncbi:MAG: hypothetical protein ACQETH_16075, partial [Candidatus Rifleibacteriota bacterium]